MIFKKLLNFILNHKIILGINYHRIGKQKNENPFKSVHSVNFNVFKIQIILIKYFFKILSLDEIQSGKVNSKINFFIKFDDVSYDSITAFNWLKSKKIPFTICPNISIIENKYSNGDRIRFIKKFLTKEEIEIKLKDSLSEEEFKLLKIGLKKFSKSYEINQVNFLIFLIIFSKILKKISINLRKIKIIYIGMIS